MAPCFQAYSALETTPLLALTDLHQSVLLISNWVGEMGLLICPQCMDDYRERKQETKVHRP